MKAKACPHVRVNDYVGDEHDWCLGCLKSDVRSLRAKLSRQTKAQARLNKAVKAWANVDGFFNVEKLRLLRAYRAFEKVSKP